MLGQSWQMDLRFCPEREASTAGKCSQPQIVNVKWGEQANGSLTMDYSLVASRIDPLKRVCRR